MGSVRPGPAVESRLCAMNRKRPKSPANARPRVWVILFGSAGILVATVGFFVLSGQPRAERRPQSAASAPAQVQAQRPDSPIVVQAGRDELRRVLINLVTNSSQAGADRVTLRASRESERVRIDVVDDGPGIPPEVLARIFEPSFTTRTSGTGLGLPIVQRIVDDLGGSVVIDSAPGHGTTVTIRLPC